MEDQLLYQIIAVLLHKLGNPQLTITEDDLNSTLAAHSADRLVIQGDPDEVHIGMYNKETSPFRSDRTYSFH